MNTWADRLRLARLLVAPPPPEAHAGSPTAWKGGWAARLAGMPLAPPHRVARTWRAWEAGYWACAEAMEEAAA